MSEVPPAAQGYLVHKKTPNPLGPPFTGVPRSEENASPYDPTVGPCLRLYGGPKGEGRFLMSEVLLYW